MFPEQLVGRAEELGSLDQALSDLDRGRSTALALVGEPGIGKTRLLVELARRADARQWLVLSGSASELERDLPFWVFVDALDEYVESLEPHRLRALDDVRTELAHILPSLSSFAVDRRAASQHERYRSYRAVRELLERLTASKPLLLVLDDLHWADAASVELVGALLRRPPSADVGLALALRPRQAPDRLSAALDRAHRAGTLSRVEVGPLTPGECQELLGAAVDATAAAALYDESGGNPFYLELLARSLAAEGTGTVAALPSAAPDLPSGVAAALAGELALLSAGARRVLEGAAVAGDPFEPEVAAAAAETTEKSALKELDELLRLDLVRETDVPRRFRFRHPLVRRAVYESTLGGWRLGAHERSSQLLAARGAPAGERAHHVQRSAQRGDKGAVSTLREAGEAAAQRAPAVAATWFGEALRLLADTAPVEMRVELLLSRARTLAATGQFADAHSALLDSLGLVPADPAALRVRLTTACAGLEHLLGMPEQAHARLASAVDLAEPGSPEAATLMIELAMDGFFRMDYELMRRWAERALSTAQPLGDLALTAAAVALLTFAHAASGATAEAEKRRSEAAHLVAELDDSELARRLDAAANLAGAELYLDHYVEAGAHAERALSVARATGQSEFIPLPHSILGQVRLLRGQLAAAGELLEDAVENARLSGNIQALAGNLVNQSLTALAAGDLDLALRIAEENAQLTRGLDRSLVCAAGVALAAARFEYGDHEGAVGILVDSSGGEELPLIPGVWRLKGLELLTRCWLGLDRRREAARSATRAEDSAAALCLGMADALAARAKAAVALDAGDAGVAAERALAAATAADGVGAPVEAALSRALAGRALAQARQPERAADVLRRAAAEFHACGALRYRAAAERELRHLGQRVHRRTRRGKADGDSIETLTERELEVARLVVDRRTNSEIAEALFLSPKTIETHLRNIFGKLDASSRIEVARAVEQANRNRDDLN